MTTRTMQGGCCVMSDMVEEPRKMLMPIKGYENVPLVTLEEAVEPLVFTGIRCSSNGLDGKREK